MDKEKIKKYSSRYKQVQKKFAIGVAIFIYLVGAAIIAGAIVLICQQNESLILVEVIMIIAATADILLGVKFLKFSLNNLKYMKPVDAAIRYSKITGKSLEEDKTEVKEETKKEKKDSE